MPSVLLKVVRNTGMVSQELKDPGADSCNTVTLDAAHCIKVILFETKRVLQHGLKRLDDNAEQNIVHA